VGEEARFLLPELLRESLCMFPTFLLGVKRGAALKKKDTTGKQQIAGKTIGLSAAQAIHEQGDG